MARPPLKFYFPHVALILFLMATIGFWSQSHQVQKIWFNVPFAPSVSQANMMGLGDGQLAYRVYATMLQNIGNSGGESIALKTYDYSRLYDWFILADRLDPRSDAVPMMAAYYFGAVQDKEKIRPVLDYLAIVGSRPEGEKWRWLGQAVFLARYELEDMDLALKLAYELAANESPDLADWARQMPAFLLQAQGKTKLAYDIMMNILISNVDTLHPNEINYMSDYICNTLIKEDNTLPMPPFCLQDIP